MAFPGARTDYKPEWQWQRFLLQDKLFAALCTPGLQYKPHGGRTMLLLKCDPELAALYRLQYPQIVPGFTAISATGTAYTWTLGWTGRCWIP